MLLNPYLWPIEKILRRCEVIQDLQFFLNNSIRDSNMIGKSSPFFIFFSNLLCFFFVFVIYDWVTDHVLTVFFSIPKI